MTTAQTELEKRNIVRLSNKEANLLTKTCLHNALIQLLEKKDINSISVSELARRAGVSRTAFYSNYQTVDDVLSEIIGEELSNLNNYVWDAINRKEDLFLPVITRMKEHYDMYSLLLKSNIERTAFFQMRDYILRTYPSIDNEDYYLIIAVVGALKSIVEEWFRKGCNESAEMIASICDSSTRNIRNKVLDHLQDL